MSIIYLIWAWYLLHSTIRHLEILNMREASYAFDLHKAIKNVIEFYCFQMHRRSIYIILPCSIPVRGIKKDGSTWLSVDKCFMHLHNNRELLINRKNCNKLNDSHKFCKRYSSILKLFLNNNKSHSIPLLSVKTNLQLILTL